MTSDTSFPEADLHILLLAHGRPVALRGLIGIEFGMQALDARDCQSAKAFRADAAFNIHWKKGLLTRHERIAYLFETDPQEVPAQDAEDYTTDLTSEITRSDHDGPSPSDEPLNLGPFMEDAAHADLPWLSPDPLPVMQGRTELEALHDTLEATLTLRNRHLLQYLRPSLRGLAPTPDVSPTEKAAADVPGPVAIRQTMAPVVEIVKWFREPWPDPGRADDVSDGTGDAEDWTAEPERRPETQITIRVCFHLCDWQQIRSEEERLQSLASVLEKLDQNESSRLAVIHFFDLCPELAGTAGQAQIVDALDGALTALLSNAGERSAYLPYVLATGEAALPAALVGPPSSWQDIANLHRADRQDGPRTHLDSWQDPTGFAYEPKYLQEHLSAVVNAPGFTSLATRARSGGIDLRLAPFDRNGIDTHRRSLASIRLPRGTAVIRGHPQADLGPTISTLFDPLARRIHAADDQALVDLDTQFARWQPIRTATALLAALAPYDEEKTLDPGGDRPFYWE